MDLGSIFIGALLFALVIFLVAQPLIEQRGVREKRVTRTDALLAERETILDALRDLDFDHAMGKLTTEDYTPQRLQLVARGAAVLRELDTLGVTTAASAEDEIERAVAARRKGKPHARR